MARRAEETAVPPGCVALHRALCDCLRRARDPLQQEVLCRYLNRSLAECIISACCPEESEAVHSLCASAGTKTKRAQCQRAQLSLSVCLASHQAPDPPTVATSAS